jgi:AcrR family transcriptional regulator
MSDARLGRPRSAVAHDAILSAVRELLVESGYADVSMDRVAARAGVGKQTVYRRWPSKAPLVADAVLDAWPGGSVALPDNGDVAEDLTVWLDGQGAVLAAPQHAALGRALAAAAADNLDDGDALYRQLTGPQHDAVIARLRIGVQTGQVRADADLAAVADAVIGVILFRMLTEASPVRDFAGLVDVLVRGMVDHNRP